MQGLCILSGVPYCYNRAEPNMEPLNFCHFSNVLHCVYFLVDICTYTMYYTMHLPCSPRYFCQAYLSINMFARAGNRKTIDGWPLLPVETEVNGNSKSTNERDPSLVGSLGLLCRYKWFLFCLGCSSRPTTKYFFPRHTIIQFLCPHRPTSWAGSRAG